MNNPLTAFLALRPWMILDGAMATELERRGADLADPLWSAKCLIERPDAIRAVHLDYFNAGADVAITATYQASFEAFEGRGIGPAAAAQLMRDAVRLAVEAREEFWGRAQNRAGRLRPLIAASIGAYGAMLADGSEYRGNYALSDSQLADFHRPRLKVLAESGADLLACETLPCLSEARVLARLLEEFPSTPAWISFSCRDGEHNCEGQRIGDCVAQLNDFPQIVALGVNCTAPQYIAPLLRQMRGRTAKPLLAYPNSGELYDAATKGWSATHETRPFADAAPGWRAAGAHLIGGCCRTRPADIAALRASAP
jgi:homocysteine S-methyltransferase